MSESGHRVPLLEVEKLEVSFFTQHGVVRAVRGTTFDIARGETVGLVGESGSGKSVTSLAILGLIDLPGKITGGDVRWKGSSLLNRAGLKWVKQVRGKELAIVFQDPMTSLNPLFTLRWQIGEVLRHHLGMGRKRAEERVVELLDLVGIPSPRERAKAYPHELSGGQRQRALIAMALACEPELLIADEPTTALDVTIQAQILELIGEIQQRLGLAVLLVTHDLGVVAGVCDRVVVMYGGKIMERGSATDVFQHPGHPYTAGLLRSTPRIDLAQHRMIGIDGSPPNMIDPPPGCPFAPRCPIAFDRCVEPPPFIPAPNGREVACWRAYDT
ncbi:MAG: ABC transporter ATP-binding protein [Gaiella sp.]|nr:ABC transporter ATP-binding protein [Gaiella sp.]